MNLYLMNKRFILIPLLIMIFSFINSCDEHVDDLLTFDSEEYCVEFTIDPLDRAGLHIFTEEALQSDLDSLMEANGVTKEKLESAHLKDAKVEIMNSNESLNFDILDLVKFTLYTDSLGESTVAEIDSIPKGVRILNLEVYGEDVQAFLYDDTYIFSAKGLLNARTFEIMELRAKFTFQFKTSLKK